MATSKSETTFNSVNLSLSEIEIVINLVFEPIKPLSDCSEKPVSKKMQNVHFEERFPPYTRAFSRSWTLQ